MSEFLQMREVSWNMERWSLARAAAGILALIVFAAACDSPVDPAEHPTGAVFLRADGSEAARFVYPATVSGGLAVNVGQTVTYRVRVLSEEGQLFDFDGSEYSIQLPRLVNAGAATIALAGSDNLVISGVQATPTTVRFQLHHGGHEEFEVAGIPLVVQ